ncbi:tetratricopeptide repeat protein [Nitrospirillum amazonense]|uniref:tetratricopeptide repeat protein n=1 Tax=Nitrospirillum amazonense TaxID=28077 RepID=UPI002DD43D69|nr:tetratricopeptide repeat protein [Nitrospirillum amazonense]MEC4592302.1 tetratricopeptide repeat protein [Nitrospirillum amazonense]
MLIDKDKMSMFESIGNNCEFGIFQRHLGFDPPGLFRNVGYLNPQQIIKCIINGLDGMFDSGTCEYVLPEGWADWRLDCQIYGFGFHSRIPREVEKDSREWQQLIKKNLAQFQFLKKKFLDDLESGEKIFVFRFKAFLNESVAGSLLKAIRQHGTGRLLYVYENPLESGPTFQVKSDGLIQASIPRLSGENPPQIDFDAWLHICRASLAAVCGITSADSLPIGAQNENPEIPSISDEPALVLSAAEKLATEEEKRQNWPALLTLSQQIRLRFPMATAAYRFEAKAHMELGRTSAAESLLEVALRLSANEPALLRLNAQLATRSGNPALALERWQTFARLYPDHQDTIISLAEAYQTVGQYAAADGQLAAAMERWPDSVSLAIKWASLAHHRNNHEEALCRWEAIRHRFPDVPEGYAAAGHSLRALGRFDEADSIVEYGLERLPDSRELLISHAWTATARRDFPSAEHRWRLVQSRWPTDGAMVMALADVVAQQGRDDEAEQILRQGVKDHPENPIIAIAFGEHVLKRSDWRRAVDIFSAIIPQFPDQLRPYTAIGHALRGLRFCDEADRYTELAMARFPGHFDLLTSYAWTAHVRGDWKQAEKRWQEVHHRFPTAGIAILNLANVMERQGRAEEGEALLAQATRDMPSDLGIAEAYAMMATRAAIWSAAVDRWQAVITRFPQSGTGYHQLALALKQMGNLEAAERILEAGVEVASNNTALLIEHAWSANLRADWPEAIRRWEALVARFPPNAMGNGSALASRNNVSAIQEGLMHARLGAGEAINRETKDNINIDGDRYPSTSAPLPPAELMGFFESLGQNCEFGLVQRFYGIEPISLFRWVGIGLPNLIRAFDNDFSGIGDASQTTVRISDGREYFIVDTEYDFAMHTFVQAETIEADKFLVHQRRRLTFLTRKLLEELELNEKIFVYFQSGDVDLEHLTRLHTAMRRFSDITLLQVRTHDDSHSAGTVDRISEGLLVGYISRFGKTPNSDWDIDYSCWLGICRSAYALWKKN